MLIAANNSISTANTKFAEGHTIRQRMLIQRKQLNFGSEFQIHCRQFNFDSESQFRWRTHNLAVNVNSLQTIQFRQWISNLMRTIQLRQRTLNLLQDTMRQWMLSGCRQFNLGANPKFAAEHNSAANVNSLQTTKLRNSLQTIPLRHRTLYSLLDLQSCSEC